MAQVISVNAYKINGTVVTERIGFPTGTSMFRTPRTLPTVVGAVNCYGIVQTQDGSQFYVIESPIALAALANAPLA